jgi:hypothetical protein
MQRILAVLIATATLGAVAAERSPTRPGEHGPPAVLGIGQFACPGPGRVEIRDASAADAQTVCEGAARALTFLARAGLAAPPGTIVQIVPRLPGELGGRAIGCYLRESRRILLLSYDAFAAVDQWFSMPADRALYRAAAAHEMAHAVVGCHAGPGRLPVAAHEYVAYVVLFATLDDGLRERLLAKFPGRGFTNTLQINDIAHIADPNQFGVDAWRHYLGRRDGAAWLRDVIAGNVVEVFPWDGP